MSKLTRRRIREELDLIERFTGSYGKKFDELIQGLNTRPTEHTGPVADGQCLRLCVEAVNMVLSFQGQMARVLEDLSNDPS